MAGQPPAGRQEPTSNHSPACLHNINTNLSDSIPTGLSLNTATIPPAQGPDPRAAQPYQQNPVQLRPGTAQDVAQVVVMLAFHPALHTHVLQFLQHPLQSGQQNALSGSLPPAVPETSRSCHVPTQHAPVQDNQTRQTKPQQKPMSCSQQSQQQRDQKQLGTTNTQTAAHQCSEGQKHIPPTKQTVFGIPWRVHESCNAPLLRSMLQTLSSMRAGTLNSVVYAALMLAGPQGMDIDDLAEFLTTNYLKSSKAALRRICATEPSITCLTPGVFTTTAYNSDRHPERGVACPLQPYSQPEMQIGQHHAHASTIVVDDITARLSMWRGAAHVAAMNWLAGKGETTEQTLARLKPGTFKCAVFMAVNSAGPKGTQASRIRQLLQGSSYEHRGYTDIRGACISDPAIIVIGTGTYAASALIEKQSGVIFQGEVGTSNQPDSSLQKQAQPVGCNRLSTKHVVLQQEQPVLVANQFLTNNLAEVDDSQSQSQLPAEQDQHQQAGDTMDDEPALPIRNYYGPAQKAALEWLAGKDETPGQTLARLPSSRIKHAVCKSLLKAGSQPQAGSIAHQPEGGQHIEGAINECMANHQRTEGNAHAVVHMGLGMTDAGTSSMIVDVPQPPQLACTHQKQLAAIKNEQGMPDYVGPMWRQGGNGCSSQAVSADNGQASQVNFQTILRSLRWPLSYEHAQALHDMLQCLKDGTDISPYEDAQCMTVHELMEELNRQELDWDMVAADLKQDVDVVKYTLLMDRKLKDMMTAVAIGPTTTPALMKPPGVLYGEVARWADTTGVTSNPIQKAAVDNNIVSDKETSFDGRTTLDCKQPVVTQPVGAVGVLGTVRWASTEILDPSYQAVLSRCVAAQNRHGLPAENEGRQDAGLQPSFHHKQRSSDEVMSVLPKTMPVESQESSSQARIAAAPTANQVRTVTTLSPTMALHENTARCPKRPRHLPRGMQDYWFSLHNYENFARCSKRPRHLSKHMHDHMVEFS